MAGGSAELCGGLSVWEWEWAKNSLVSGGGGGRG